MKYWRKAKVENGYGSVGISFNDEEGRIVSLSRSDGFIVFMEECDGHFSHKLTKEDAKAALLEAIDWIDRGGE